MKTLQKSRNPVEPYESPSTIPWVKPLKTFYPPWKKTLEFSESHLAPERLDELSQRLVLLSLNGIASTSLATESKKIFQVARALPIMRHTGNPVALVLDCPSPAMERNLSVKKTSVLKHFFSLTRPFEMQQNTLYKPQSLVLNPYPAPPSPITSSNLNLSKFEHFQEPGLRTIKKSFQTFAKIQNITTQLKSLPPMHPESSSVSAESLYFHGLYGDRLRKTAEARRKALALPSEVNSEILQILPKPEDLRKDEIPHIRGSLDIKTRDFSHYQGRYLVSSHPQTVKSFSMRADKQINIPDENKNKPELFSKPQGLALRIQQLPKVNEKQANFSIQSREPLQSIPQPNIVHFHGPYAEKLRKTVEARKKRAQIL